MRRLITLILATAFILPVCGNVLAYAPMDMGTVSPKIETMEMTSEAHEAAMTMNSDHFQVERIDSSCEHQSNSSSSGMDCCNTDSDHSKIGILVGGPGEKIVKYVKIGFVSSVEFLPAELVKPSKFQFSTAPPENRENYANLIGIIKNLN